METGKDTNVEHLSSVPPQEFNDSFDKIEHVSTNEDIDSRALGGDSVADLPKHYYWSWSFIATLAGMSLAYQSTYIFFTMQSLMLYLFIAPSLGNPPNFVWISLANVVAQTTTFPVVGRMADIFGRRYFFLVGCALNVVGNIICGRGTNVNMIIGGQVLVGISTSLIQGCGSAFAELVPKKHRFLAIGFIWTCLLPVGFLNPVIAVSLGTNVHEGWRWNYYLPAIMTGISFFLLFFGYHPPTFGLLHKHQTKWQAFRSIDWLGLGIFLASVVLFLLGISWGGQQYPWKSARVISTICLGPVLMAVFFIWESYYPEDGKIIPAYLFKSRNYVTLALVAAVGSMIFYATNVVFSQQTTNLFGASILRSGWFSLAITVGAQTGQLAGGVLVRPIGYTRIQLIVVCVVFTAFIGGAAGVTYKDEAMLVAFTTISSFLLGYMEVIAQIGAPLAAKDKDVGVAYAVVGSFRTMMSALATSIYVTVLTNQLTENIPKYILPAAVNAGLPQSSGIELLEALASGTTTALQKVPGIDTAVLGAVSLARKIAYQKSFMVVYLVGLPFGVISIIAAVLTKDLGSTMTSSIPRKLQHAGDESNIQHHQPSEPAIEEKQLAS